MNLDGHKLVRLDNGAHTTGDTAMQAIIDFLTSNEPATPSQAVTVIVTFFSITIINLTIALKGRKDKRK